MRNQYAGNCYRCGLRVEPGTGYFEKIHGTRNSWRVQHCYRTHGGGITCEMAKVGRTKPSRKEERKEMGL